MNLYSIYFIVKGPIIMPYGNSLVNAVCTLPHLLDINIKV